MSNIYKGALYLTPPGDPAQSIPPVIASSVYDLLLMNFIHITTVIIQHKLDWTNHFSPLMFLRKAIYPLQEIAMCCNFSEVAEETGGHYGTVYNIEQRSEQ